MPFQRVSYTALLEFIRVSLQICRPTSFDAFLLARSTMRSHSVTFKRFSGKYFPSFDYQAESFPSRYTPEAPRHSAREVVLDEKGATTVDYGITLVMQAAKNRLIRRHIDSAGRPLTKHSEMKRGILQRQYED